MSTLAANVVHSHYPQAEVGEYLPQVLGVVKCRLGRRLNRLRTGFLPGNSGEPGRGQAPAPSGPGCCLWSNNSQSVLVTCPCYSSTSHNYSARTAAGKMKDLLPCQVSALQLEQSQATLSVAIAELHNHCMPS